MKTIGGRPRFLKGDRWYPLGNPGTRRAGALTRQALPEELKRLLE